MGIGKGGKWGANKFERAKHDFYPTSQGTTRSILPLLRPIFPLKVWECACGEGHMADELLHAGFDVVSTDLIDRGYGRVLDFLACTEPLAEGIITNPPFNLAEEFIRHALTILGIENIALVLPQNFWNAACRLPLFRDFAPSLIFPMTWRTDQTGEGNPTHSLQWNVWVKGMRRTQFMPIAAQDPRPGVIHAPRFCLE